MSFTPSTPQLLLSYSLPRVSEGATFTVSHTLWLSGTSIRLEIPPWADKVCNVVESVGVIASKGSLHYIIMILPNQVFNLSWYVRGKRHPFGHKANLALQYYAVLTWWVAHFLSQDFQRVKTNLCQNMELRVWGQMRLFPLLRHSLTYPYLYLQCAIPGMQFHCFKSGTKERADSALKAA